jgi:NAD(P)-dependent dehydrogenase (short-subunit alcohol dehydrogenase family)
MPMDYDERIITAGIPMGRQGTNADIGGAALFLASNLSDYITGTTLHPDGGAWASAGWWKWPEQGCVNNPPLTGRDQY